MKTALLIIDIQNDYFPGGKMELIGSVQAAATALRLLSAFRKQSWPVYHVQHISMQPGVTFFLPGTEGAAIHKTVKRCHDVVHEMGAPRITTTIKLGTRTDRSQSMEDKVRSVKDKL